MRIWSRRVVGRTREPCRQRLTSRVPSFLCKPLGPRQRRLAKGRSPAFRHNPSAAARRAVTEGGNRAWSRWDKGQPFRSNSFALERRRRSAGCRYSGARTGSSNVRGARDLRRRPESGRLACMQSFHASVNVSPAHWQMCKRAACCGRRLPRRAVRGSPAAVARRDPRSPSRHTHVARRRRRKRSGPRAARARRPGHGPANEGDVSIEREVRTFPSGADRPRHTATHGAIRRLDFRSGSAA